MLASILTGGATLVGISLTAALILFAHLTGRIRRATALGVAALATASGVALASGGLMGCMVLGRGIVPFGVFLTLAASINGFLAYQAKSGR